MYMYVCISKDSDTAPLATIQINDRAVPCNFGIAAALVITPKR